MLKVMINARPTSRGMYSSLDHTCVFQTLVQTFGLCTRVDTSPRTPISVGFFHVASIGYTHIYILINEFKN